MHQGGRSQVRPSAVISEYLRRFAVSFPYTPVAILLPSRYLRPNLSHENKNWIRNATDQYQVRITIPKIEFKNSNRIYNATSFEIYILFGFYCQLEDWLSIDWEGLRRLPLRSDYFLDGRPRLRFSLFVVAALSGRLFRLASPSRAF